MLELRRITYFVQVAETGSLTKAAIGLDVSHSVLSRQIQQFEIELGHRLFHRTGRGLRLTDYGRRLLPRAQQVMREAARFSDEASTLRHNPSGKVVVGLPGSVAPIIAGPLFRAVNAEYPDIVMRFVEGLSGVLEELLALGRIDIALFYTNSANARRGDIALTEASLYLVGPPGDALTARETIKFSRLVECPLVLPSRPNALRVIVDEHCAKAGREAFVPCEIDSLSALKEVVAMGTGYTLCTYDAISREIASGELQAALVVNPRLTRVLVMTLASKNLLTTAAQTVANTISVLARQLIKDGQWRPVSA